MNFLTLFFQSIVNFVRRNPLLVLLLVILAVGAPSLLRGIASFIFIFIGGILLLLFIFALVMRWRIYKLQRQMQDQFKRAAGGPDAFYTFYNQARQQQQQQQQQQQRRNANPAEGDVRVHKTGDVPEKRISGNVGDYVDFEETK